MCESFRVPASTVESKQRSGTIRILVVSFLLLGLWSVTIGAKGEGFQQIHQDGIKGVLLNVPLRSVLSQLQEGLHFEYTISEEIVKGHLILTHLGHLS